MNVLSLKVLFNSNIQQQKKMDKYIEYIEYINKHFLNFKLPEPNYPASEKVTFLEEFGRHRMLHAKSVNVCSILYVYV